VLPGAEVRVVDPATGQAVAAGQPGEFWFRSAQRMIGYLNKPADTAEAITEGGWLRSGDIGHVDDTGYLYVSDRVKDMIITGGENVYSPEVEQVVAEHPAGAEVAVIGVPDDRWGEAIKAVIALRPGQHATGPEIIGFARERLAHYKCPSTVDVGDARPRNPCTRPPPAGAPQEGTPSAPRAAPLRGRAPTRRPQRRPEPAPPR